MRELNRDVLCCVLAAMLLAIARSACAAEISLWPVAELDEIYDNNIELTPANRKGDFVTSETFGATLEAATATRNLYLTYQTSLLEYASYPGHDRFGNNHYANLSDDEKLSKNTTLSISDSMLVGNAVSSGILANGTTPIGSQLMQSLLYQSSNLSNSLGIDLFSKYSHSFSWTANVHQNFFSTLSSSSSAGSGGNGEFFNQGGALAGLWNFPERFTAGFAYQFDDFRSSTSQPTSETNWPQARMTWGEGTPFSFLGQVGPIISSSSSGTLLTTGSTGVGMDKVPAETQVQAGYLVRGSYKDRRLTVSAFAGRQPSFGGGFAFATAQSYGVLINYKLSRRATIFGNAAYYDQSHSGSSEQVLSFTGGITYRLTEYLTLSANYFCFQTKATGAAAVGTFIAAPGARSTVNLFQAGIQVAPLPFKWRT